MKELSPPQIRLMFAILEHRRLNGYSPTRKELADAFGVSKQAIDQTLERLQRKGLVSWQPRRMASLALTREGMRWIQANRRVA